MPEPLKFQVGQRFWFESWTQRSKSCYVEITRVGRKYAYFDSPLRRHIECAADKKTLCVAPQLPPRHTTYGRLRTEEDLQGEQNRIKELWRSLAKKIAAQEPPGGMTEDRITDAASSLWLMPLIESKTETA